jgi:hypothetical protein
MGLYPPKCYVYNVLSCFIEFEQGNDNQTVVLRESYFQANPYDIQNE